MLENSRREVTNRASTPEIGGFCVPGETGPQALSDLTAPGRHRFLAGNLARKKRTMARHNWSVQDAKNRFSEVVEAARRTPQTVTKHGKPAVVVLDVVEYERLRRLESGTTPSFADLLLAMPQDNGKFPRHDVPTSDFDI
jgi:prevent-host-death family protein